MGGRGRKGAEKKGGKGRGEEMEEKSRAESCPNSGSLKITGPGGGGARL